VKEILCLASTSLRRRELLGKLKVPFYIQTPRFPELGAEALAWLSPRELALRNALGKALSVWDERLHPKVLAADTAVALGSLCLGKPKDLEEAKGMLNLLSGKTHRVFTALVLVDLRRRIEARICQSEVEFHTLSLSLIERYLAEVPVLDKAGAYAAQEKADWIIKEIRGSYSNVLGLPLEETALLLKTSPLALKA
jgi:septum formation protein